jgi:hypothetical protein
MGHPMPKIHRNSCQRRDTLHGVLGMRTPHDRAGHHEGYVENPDSTVSDSCAGAHRALRLVFHEGPVTGKLIR